MPNKRRMRVVETQADGPQDHFGTSVAPNRGGAPQCAHCSALGAWRSTPKIGAAPSPLAGFDNEI
jgi:hypothetical protein